MGKDPSLSYEPCNDFSVSDLHLITDHTVYWCVVLKTKKNKKNPFVRIKFTAVS